MRRCLDCVALLTRGSRCAVHEAAYRLSVAKRGTSGWQRQRDNDRVVARDGGCVLRHEPNHRCSGALVVDHVVALADGGSDGDANKRTLCERGHKAVTAAWRRRRAG